MAAMIDYANVSHFYVKLNCVSCSMHKRSLEIVKELVALQLRKCHKYIYIKV
jgi:hypothetical protein